MKKLILTLMILAVLIPLGYARENMGSQPQSFNKPMVIDYKLVNVNSISAWVKNNGELFRHPTTGNSGFEYPAGGGVFAIYASGLWIGARGPDGNARVAIAEYSQEFGPGKIIGTSAAPPSDSRYEVYKLVTTDVIPQAAIDDGLPAQILGDQFLWCVYNDADPSYHVNFGTAPLKIEVQQSVFAFARTGALGNTVFVKWLVINKSGAELRDTYITVWSDPDLGDSGDDFVGSDSVLSLGYVYNSNNNDSEYGAAPPAAGYDFFQGPIVPSVGDTAHVSGQEFVDFRNLPMTSFIYYNNTTANNGNPQTAPEVYNYMQARWRDGTPITEGGTGIDPNNPQTRYMFTGDPEAGTGWLDSSPADRRFMMTTGPFTMEPWTDSGVDSAGTKKVGTVNNGKEDIGEAGTQEIVVGVIVARGADNLGSVSLLKQFDDLAQKAYDLNFDLALPPPAPVVDVTVMDRQIILDWANTDPTLGATFKEVEAYDAKDPLVIPTPENPDPDTTYTFQGYLVYQYDFLDRRNERLIANYDLIDGIVEVRDFVLDVGTGEFLEKLVWKGTDSGLQRFLSITKDQFSASSLATLINGKRYWFSVVAWGYNADSSPKSIQSPFVTDVNFLEITPQSPAIGTRYDQSIIGDFIPAEKEGPSDGGALGVVVDPTKLTGHDYRIEFDRDAENQVYWRLLDLETTPADAVLDLQYFQSADTAALEFPTADGIQWKVLGPPPGINVFEVVANAAGPLDPSEMGCFAFNSNGFPFLFNSLYPDGTDRPDGARQQTNGSTWGVNVGGGANDGTYATFLSRSIRNDNGDRLAPYDYEMRFTAAGGVGVWAFTTGNAGTVPFELWNVGIGTWNDPSDDYRMIPWVLDEVDVDDVYDFGTDNGVGLDHGVSGGANDPYLDWVYWLRPNELDPGTVGYDLFADSALAGTYNYSGAEVMARTVLVNWNGGDCTDPTFPANVDALMPEEGTIFRIVTTKPNSPADVYTFTNTPSAQTYNSQSLAKKEIDKINVFPNPYYGTHSGERNVVEKWVEFTHLPPTCTIRLFNLAGVLVRTLEREGVTDRTWEKWDLQNESELPVASGIYIYHIEIPGVGDKIGKMAIFLPEERLDTI